MSLSPTVTATRTAAESALAAVQTAQANLASAIDSFFATTLPPLVTAYVQAAGALAGAGAAANQAEAGTGAPGTTYAIPGAASGAGYRGAVLSAYRAYARVTPGAPTLP